MRSSQCQNQRTFGATHYTKGRMLLALRRSDRAEYVPSMLVELTTRPGLRLASGKRGVWPADWLAQAGSLAWLPPRYHETSEVLYILYLYCSIHRALRPAPHGSIVDCDGMAVCGLGGLVSPEGYAVPPERSAAGPPPFTSALQPSRLQAPA